MMPDGIAKVADFPSEAVSPSAPQDRAGASQSEVEELRKPDPTARALAFGVTGGFFVLLFLLCFRSAPAENQAMLNIVLGSLATASVGIIAYFFGSTQSGRAKDWMLYQSQPSSPSK